jgi:predicted metal-dependent hydrolase
VASTEITKLEVAGLQVQVVRKDIKNLHLGVYPPVGRIRVAAPRRVDDEAVRLAVVGKLGWIRRQQERFVNQERQTRREMVDGESHYNQGQRYRLAVVEKEAAPAVRIANKSRIEIQVRPGTSRNRREEILNEWYRTNLRDQIKPLVEAWADKLEVGLPEWQIRRMKTRWGSCNTDRRRILFNLELAKKPHTCVEYLVVHELIHLLERQHTPRFTELMDTHYPTWRSAKSLLNAQPLAYEDWTY